MKIRKTITVLAIISFSVGFLFLTTFGNINTAFAQQATGSVPTVTGTPKGPMASIKPGITENFVNVRSGPSSVQFDIIGIIYIGETVPVKGKSIGGDWLLIEYPGVVNGEGWIWALYMDLTPGEIPLVEMPPSPQPNVTFTIDPTMASQFITTPLATRLPTFTPPANLVIPTYENIKTQIFAGVPIGFIIIILLGIGIISSLFTYFQSR
jgi:hypothetical protein